MQADCFVSQPHHLQYIHDLQRRAEERGSAAPKRLGRIAREVEALMERVRKGDTQGVSAEFSQAILACDAHGWEAV